MPRERMYVFAGGFEPRFGGAQSIVLSSVRLPGARACRSWSRWVVLLAPFPPPPETSTMTTTITATSAPSSSAPPSFELRGADTGRLASPGRVRGWALCASSGDAGAFGRGARAALCRERVERRVRTVAHRALGDREHVGDLPVALAPVEHEREHGALVGGQSVEVGHRLRALAAIMGDRWAPLGYRGRPMTMPLAAQINEVLLGFDRLYGLELLECSDTQVRAQVSVRDELKQPAGLVHGGVYASIAESMASLATGSR